MLPGSVTGDEVDCWVVDTGSVVGVVVTAVVVWLVTAGEEAAEAVYAKGRGGGDQFPG